MTQKRENRTADRRVRQKWEVAPSTDALRNLPLIRMQLGTHPEIHIPPEMAIYLANALTDAVEAGETTTHKATKRKDKPCCTNDPNTSTSTETRTGEPELNPQSSDQGNPESASNTATT